MVGVRSGKALVEYDPERTKPSEESLKSLVIVLLGFVLGHMSPAVGIIGDMSPAEGIICVIWDFASLVLGQSRIMLLAD